MSIDRPDAAGRGSVPEWPACSMLLMYLPEVRYVKGRLNAFKAPRSADARTHFGRVLLKAAITITATQQMLHNVFIFVVINTDLRRY